MNLLYNFLLIIFVTLTLSHADSPYGPLTVDVEMQSEGSNVSVYEYDTAGNRLSGSYHNNNDTTDYSISYGLIGKPVNINIPDRKPEIFKYRPGGSRYLRVNADGEKIFYIGNSEYQINADGVKSIVYIRSGAYSPIAQVDTSSSTPIYKYFLQDHQGSTLVIVNNNGAAQNPKRYDPWGVPVAASGIDLSPDVIDDSARDFTGHERIKSAGLIHANGRVLDPLSGFISPDPVLFNGNLVSHNRYAYVLNSGPNHVDINGYSPTETENHIRLLAFEARSAEYARSLPNDYLSLPPNEQKVMESDALKRALNQYDFIKHKWENRIRRHTGGGNILPPVRQVPNIDYRSLPAPGEPGHPWHRYKHALENMPEIRPPNPNPNTPLENLLAAADTARRGLDASPTFGVPIDGNEHVPIPAFDTLSAAAEHIRARTVIEDPTGASHGRRGFMPDPIASPPRPPVQIPLNSEGRPMLHDLQLPGAAKWTHPRL